MSRLSWDNISERYFETGISHGVLFIMNDNGTYNNGVAWNGLVGVTEKHSGGDAIHVYANEYPYTDIYELETFEATLDAYTYPDEFEACQGFYWSNAMLVGQQKRKHFALCYRTVSGNDNNGTDYGYKIHILYDCITKPSEREYKTINNSVDFTTFSWDLNITPISVSGYLPVPMIIIDSRKTTKGVMAKIESYLYGSPSNNPSLLFPADASSILNANTHYLVTEYGESITFGGTRILV